MDRKKEINTLFLDCLILFNEKPSGMPINTTFFTKKDILKQYPFKEKNSFGLYSFLQDLVIGRIRNFNLFCIKTFFDSFQKVAFHGKGIAGGGSPCISS